MKYCQKCNKKYEDGEYCIDCGSALTDIRDVEDKRGKTCPYCNNPVSDSAEFCSNCGSSLNGSSKIKDYSSAIKGTLNHPTVQGALVTLKNMFIHPALSLDSSIKEKSVVNGLFPTAVMLISSLVFWLSLAGKIDMTFGISKFYFPGVVFAFLMCLGFVLIPSVINLTAIKVRGKEVKFSGIFNTSSWCTVYTAVLILLSGIMTMVSVKFATVLFVIALALNAFASVSLTNKLADNLFESPKVLWITFIVSFIVKVLFIALFFKLLEKSAGGYVYEVLKEIMYSFMW